jgi:hypothetical protein
MSSSVGPLQEALLLIFITGLLGVLRGSRDVITHFNGSRFLDFYLILKHDLFVNMAQAWMSTRSFSVSLYEGLPELVCYRPHTAYTAPVSGLWFDCTDVVTLTSIAFYCPLPY